MGEMILELNRAPGNYKLAPGSQNLAPELKSGLAGENVGSREPQNLASKSNSLYIDMSTGLP